MKKRDSGIGHIVRLGGGIADIRFDGALPAITTRLVTLTDPEIVIEVAGLPGEGLARGLVMNPSPDLRIGLAVRDTGAPIEVPVGEAVLGRMFNVFGDTIDDGPQSCCIHAQSPVSLVAGTSDWRRLRLADPM
jgi:F-type H+/Na+-transporting ATPase subunit beta